MDSILVVVHYNEEWDENNNYNNFEVVGVDVDRECDYNGMKQLVSEQLKINSTDQSVVLKYQLQSSYPPIVIDSDASLGFYKKVKTRETDFMTFPVCTTITERRQCTNNDVECSTQQAILGESDSLHLQRLRDALLPVSGQQKFSLVDFANEAANSIVKDVDELMMSKNVIESQIDEVPSKEIGVSDVFVGKLFPNEHILRKTIILFAMSQKFSFRVVKSRGKKYFATCWDTDCGWFVKASIVGRSSVFKIRSLDTTHTCPVNKRMNAQRHVTSQVVSDCVKRKYCDLKMIYTPSDIIKDMKDIYGVDVTYKKAWRAKKKAEDEVRGKPDESYNVISRYLEKVIDVNSGSFARVKKSDDQHFEFLFMSLYAAIKGWHHCRPVVVVDGTFLKASYGGTLLTASVQDSNGHILPLAFSIVDSENDKSYHWFFENLRSAIGTRTGMCIVLDRNESLLKAVDKVYPEVAHCCCVFHLGKNVKRYFKKNMALVHQKFMAATMAYTVDEFNTIELDMLDARVVEYLTGVGFDQWARAHCPHNHFLAMTSNVAESLNAALKYAKDLPVTTLLECLRATQQKWNVKNGDEARNTFTTLSKKGNDMLEDSYKMSSRMTIRKASDVVYEVSIGQAVYVVDMEKKVCTCNRFQMDELPCAHAACVLRGLHEDSIKYCSKYYLKETMVATYEETVYPVGRDGQLVPNSDSEDESVLPPVGRTKVGRPRRSRIKSVGEYRGKTRCSRCLETGHNKKTCRAPPAAI